MSFPFNVYLLAVVSACVTVLAALPLWRRWCLRTGLVDEPGHRKIHDQPTPLAGGLAVMTGLLLPLLAGVLLALTQKGVSREDAYALVQRNAMPVWRGEGDFVSLLKADKDVAKALSPAELEALFDLDYHLEHVDAIFARVFGE